MGAGASKPAKRRYVHRQQTYGLSIVKADKDHDVSQLTNDDSVSALSCPPGPDPDTTNVCSLKPNQAYRLPHFCTLAGSGGKQNRLTWCGKLGANGEWGVEDTNGSGSCNYDDCGAFKEATGCCRGCCAIAGSGVNCQRRKFRGDPLECCLQDLECNGGLPTTGTESPAACFSDMAKKRTCDPCNRSLTSGPETVVYTGANGRPITCAQTGSSSCQEIMYDYCTGADLNPTDTSWIDRWVDAQGNPQSCIRALERNLFQNYPQATKCQTVGGLNLTGPCRPVTRPATLTGQSDQPNSAGVDVQALSSDGVAWGTQLMNGVFNKYRDQGFVVGSVPGQLGYNPFQNTLYTICCNAPIICQSGLSNTCSVYTAQRLSLNPNAANWCGCYLPDEEYEKYVNQFGVNKECTPTCNRSTTIPLVAGDNTAILCNQTVCIIDDVTINLNNTNLNGGVNISQICGNCSGTLNSASSCSCIVENTTVDAANAQLGNINLNTSCTSSRCVVSNPGGFPDLPATLPVPCDQTSDPKSVYEAAQAALNQSNANALTKKIVTYLVIIGLIILVLFLLWWFLRPSVNTKVKVPPPPPPKPETPKEPVTPSPTPSPPPPPPEPTRPDLERRPGFDNNGSKTIGNLDYTAKAVSTGTGYVPPSSPGVGQL